MSILSFLNPLKPLIDAAERAHGRYLNAKNDQERIAAEKEMSFWEGRVDAVSVAAQHDKPWSPRSIMGLSVAVYVVKLIVWDTVIGSIAIPLGAEPKLFVTENPGEQVTAIAMTVVGFYFVSRAAETISSTIANAIARRSQR